VTDEFLLGDVPVTAQVWSVPGRVPNHTAYEINEAVGREIVGVDLAIPPRKCGLYLVKSGQSVPEGKRIMVLNVDRNRYVLVLDKLEER
jgi:hypothetical protein